MLDSNNHSLWPNWLSEYWESFLEYLKDKNLDWIQNWDRIIDACKKSEENVLWKTRQNWDVAESHPYEVTKIYVELHRSKISENWIISSLLHDYVEDNSTIPEEHKERVEEVNRLFWTEVGILVDLLSKPNFNLYNWEFDFEKKEARNRDYFWNFSSLKSLKEKIKCYFWENNIRWQNSNDISKFAFIIACVKLCDRIHNLTTLDENVYTIEKMQRKIYETKKYLTYLALEIWRTHPLILEKFRGAVIRAERRLTSLKARRQT